MKNEETFRNLSILLLLFAVVGLANANVLLEYRMGVNTPTFQAPGFTGGILTPGTGLSLFQYTSDMPYATLPSLAISTVNTTPTLAAAMGNNSWFTFTLTVGSAVNLDKLSLNAARGGGATPRGFGVYAKVNALPEEQVQGATNFPTQRYDWGSVFVINLAGFSNLQGLVPGDVVTFKIPVYMPTAITNTIDLDNIIVEGTGVSKASTPNPLNGATGINYSTDTTLSWNAGLAVDLVDPNMLVPNPVITSHFLTLSIPYPVGTTEPNWLVPGHQTFIINPDTNPVDGHVDAVAAKNVGHLNPDSVYFWKVDEYINGITPPSNDPNVAFGSTWSFRTTTMAPTVDAGNSVVIWLVNGSKTINLDATVTFVSPAVKDYTLWSVYNTPSVNPGDPNVTIANTGAIDTTATFTRTGQFVLELYAKDNTGADASDRIEITVYADSCTAARNNPNNTTFGLSAYDFNSDCLVNLTDFALFASAWLDDRRLAGDEYYDAGIISAPTITINAPLDGATVSGTVTINAAVYDEYVGTNNGDGIQMVYINVYSGTDPATRVLVASNGQTGTAPPYTLVWPTLSGANPDGVYTIRVSAQSSYGFRPKEITVTLDNTP